MPRYNRKPDLGRQVQNLARQQASQGTAARNQATSISSGATTIRDQDGVTPLVVLGELPDGDRGLQVAANGKILLDSGGQIVVVDDQGRTVAVLGALLGPSKPQDGFTLSADYDGDKYVAFALADYGTDTGPVRSVLAQYDHNGWNAVATDIGSPLGGLASPHLPGTSLRDTNITTWPQTTNTTWTTVADGYFEVQNPRITWQIQSYCAVGGQIRVSMNGSVIATRPVPVNSFDLWSAVFDYPAGIAVGQTYPITLEAQVTGGAGTLYVQDQRIQGAPSASGTG